MTNKIINILILVNFTVFCYAQNIGQNDDTLVNYIDINGLKQGYWQKDYYNGNIKYKGYFKNNKLVGEFKRYSNKGKLIAILFYDETGDTANAKIFHENSKLAASGIYIMKIKHGNWKYYNENGLLLLEESYNFGVKHGLSKQYFLNGSIYKEVEYKDGKINGISKRYYTNGNINFFINYKDGLCHGDYYIYFESGKIEIKGKYPKASPAEAKDSVCQNRQRRFYSAENCEAV